MYEPTRYQRPGQSSYARKSWWGRHLAEFGGAVGGFALGFVLTVLLGIVGVDSDWPGFLPIIGAIVGALTLRWVARPRQAPDRTLPRI